MAKEKREYTAEEVNIYNIPLADFFQFALSIDCVVFGYDGKELKILLIERGVEPMKGLWALPGDLVRTDIDIETSAKIILKNLTGVDGVFLKQVQSFGEVERHPLGRVVTIAYYALVDISAINIDASPASWANTPRWWSLSELPELGFDHANIITACKEHLLNDAKFHPIGFELLPNKFTLAQFQELYEAIYQMKLDRSNFRKKLKSLNILKELNEVETDVSHRPAKLYKFDEKRYQKLKEAGFFFDIGL